MWVLSNQYNHLLRENSRLQYGFNIIRSFIKLVMSTYFMIGPRDIKIMKTDPFLKKLSLAGEIAM